METKEIFWYIFKECFLGIWIMVSILEFFQVINEIKKEKEQVSFYTYPVFLILCLGIAPVLLLIEWTAPYIEKTLFWLKDNWPLFIIIPIIPIALLLYLIDIIRS